MAFCIYHGDALSGENRACPKCAEEFQLDGYDVIRAIAVGWEPIVRDRQRMPSIYQ